MGGCDCEHARVDLSPGESNGRYVLIGQCSMARDQGGQCSKIHSKRCYHIKAFNAEMTGVNSYIDKNGDQVKGGIELPRNVPFLPKCADGRKFQYIGRDTNDVHTMKEV